MKSHKKHNVEDKDARQGFCREGKHNEMWVHAYSRNINKIDNKQNLFSIF